MTGEEPRDPAAEEVLGISAGVERHVRAPGTEAARFDPDAARAAGEPEEVLRAGEVFNAWLDGRARPGPAEAAGALGLRVWGRWCGPGHGGSGTPVDTLDAICMRHDRCYASQGYLDCGCDAQLVAEITASASQMTPAERFVAAAIKAVFSVGLCIPSEQS
ncbi:hypothetical protein GC722_16550 [Auraticoccus sp. F435]|uniref:Phospholipase A2-like central domain-containing protein n=1 Tax=Auraticoccus cholistanensis TaxID=2656650 RepID=A0A6A9V222_9ACTN|nr:phospholipase A2 family protein [Auraticoccus cholistanensis]MVA77614.1 hypothetical protein [Auraticoccus cholistanensis]